MKALNRKEALVNAKANGTLDGFKPLTREEAFTKKALELGGGGVTVATFTITLNENDEIVVTHDKSFEECFNAAANGVLISKIVHPYTGSMGENVEITHTTNIHEVNWAAFESGEVLGRTLGITYPPHVYLKNGQEVTGVLWESNGEHIEALLAE